MFPQTGSSLEPSRTEHQESWPSSSLLVRPACMHDGHFIPFFARTTQHAPHPPLSLPAPCSRICGLSSVSVTQYRRPRPLVALTGSSLTQKDRLSHAAGDAPLACRLSLYLNAVLWMQPDKGLQRLCKCPFLTMTPDVGVQEHYSYPGRFILCIGITLHESVT